MLKLVRCCPRPGVGRVIEMTGGQLGQRWQGQAKLVTLASPRVCISYLKIKQLDKLNLRAEDPLFRVLIGE